MWISVKEQTPPLNRQVFLWSKVKFNKVNIIQVHTFKSPVREKDILAYCKGARITHWSMASALGKPFQSPPRSKYVKVLMKERDDLIEKLGWPTKHLTPKEKKRLEEIERELFDDGKIFAKGNKDDEDARVLIRHAAKLLKEKDKHLPCPFIKLQEFGLKIDIMKSRVIISFKSDELRATYNHIVNPETVTFGKR